MWLCTEAGINKYDGNKFTVYECSVKNPESLSNSFVLTSYKDHNGTLWFGTDNGGLNRFDYSRNKFIRYTHDPDNSQSISCNRVYAIYETRSGELWIGTDCGGLNRLDRSSNTFTQYIHNPSSRAPDWFIKVADDALYQSKQNGRNRVTKVVIQKGVAAE
jgi:ligand-binding sensor domain-containing protein